MSREELDRALIAAHQADDKVRLVELYLLAGDECEREGDIDAACFYLTHAFVFALEIDDMRVAMLNRRLVDHGRAHPLD